jgi:hypothetical protein
MSYASSGKTGIEQEEENIYHLCDIDTDWGIMKTDAI